MKRNYSFRGTMNIDLIRYYLAKLQLKSITIVMPQTRNHESKRDLASNIQLPVPSREFVSLAKQVRR
jgi:hypothetical protein